MVNSKNNKKMAYAIFLFDKIVEFEYYYFIGVKEFER